MKRRFEELEIGVEEFKGGDIVLQRNGQQTYTLHSFGETFFHKHKFVEVVFDDGSSHRFYLDEIVGKRTVLRRID